MNWKIFVSSHPDALKVIWKGLLIGAILVLLFQILTTGWFLQSVSQPSDLVFLGGCGLGFVIACLEYAMIEALRNQWQMASRDSQITTGEGILLLGIATLGLVVVMIDALSTANGAVKIGFNPDIAWIWGVGQLFCFEFLLNMTFHVRDISR